MIPANLIINADDFGIDESVSRAILLCLEEGLINSFSVLPFADSFHDRLLRDIVARFPDARIGVHMSLIGPSETCRLDAASGEFAESEDHFLHFLARYVTGRYPAERVRREWKAQIEFVGAYVGGTHKLAHLDSHQHLHVLPGLWDAAKTLQWEFSIPRLRVPYESLLKGFRYRFPFGMGLQALAWLRQGRGDPGFIGFFTSTRFTFTANRRSLARVLRLPGRAFELMVHPALPSHGLESRPSTIAASQEEEIEELRSLRSFYEGCGPR
ncbi:MAG: ChbG/HpnK family deacetylase [Fibrobacteria bacterium]